ncbi:MAG: metal-dependent transcriptional regulator [Candidatus Hatepunaea meridiana]|nr:metal-dependent transcriptional regulator [Candidatus Hatepunaea meridiana]
MDVSKRLSASLEDYLEAIYHIVKKKQAAKAKDIAMQLDVNSSSVTGALQSLSKRGLVNYAPYDLITLTPEGSRIAEDVIRRHKALYRFFTVVLSVDEVEAQEMACKMEHDISTSVLDRLIQYLDFVDNCPIGGITWNEELGFTCKHMMKFGSCEKCAEEFKSTKE